MRMDSHAGAQQTAPMDDLDDELMELAEQAALLAFGERMVPEHIQAVYEALAWMLDAGLPTDGALTVH